MELNEYQKHATATAIYPGRGKVEGLLYTALGLGEAGEVQGKVKKVLRDDAGVLSEDKRWEIADEVGDLLWYIACIAQELDIPLREIAENNLFKLQDRAERGVLQGSGDTR